MLDPLKKFCPDCGVIKPRSEFGKAGKKIRGYCKPCHCARTVAWQQANAEKYRARWNAWDNKRRRDAGIPVKVKTPEYKAARKRAYALRPDVRARNDACKRRYHAANPHVMAEVVRRRQIAKRNATPAWANRFYLQEAYDLSRRRTAALGERHVVDHIVPIISSLVCGLHCEANVRVITAAQNRAKGNRAWPDMP